MENKTKIFPINDSCTKNTQNVKHYYRITHKTVLWTSMDCSLHCLLIREL